MRKLQDNAIKDNITGEWLPLQQGSSDTGIEIKETPVVAVTSLSALVKDLLEEYDQWVHASTCDNVKKTIKAKH